jgi:hypothetical protein
VKTYQSVEVGGVASDTNARQSFFDRELLGSRGTLKGKRDLVHDAR